ncbi:MAG: hypothetical protein ACOC32_01235 [Nanoarchaeota archaeon]
MEKKSRGRPVKSEIRQNVVDLLEYSGPAYGYEIFKHYVELFPRVTMRSIYYHLSKGIDTKEIKIHSVRKVKGDYSWGTDAQKTFYTLGPSAQPRGQKRINEYFSKKKR